MVTIALFEPLLEGHFIDVLLEPETYWLYKIVNIFY